MSACVTLVCAAAGAASVATSSAATAARITECMVEFLLVSPRHQPLDPADAGQIVINDCDHQHHEEDKSAEQHLLLHRHAEVAAGYALEHHDEDVTAVQHRDRQQIQQPKVQSERSHQREK